MGMVHFPLHEPLVITIRIATQLGLSYVASIYYATALTNLIYVATTILKVMYMSN